MVDVDELFDDGFHSNSTAGRDDPVTLACVDYMTNTHQLRVPTDDPERLALAYTVASREEFLHGRTVPGIVVSASRLKHAAGYALIEATRECPEPDPDLLGLARSAHETEQWIIDSIRPFKEAVDKFLLLTTISEVGSEQGAYPTLVREALVDEYGSDVGEAAEALISDHLDTELERINGELVDREYVDHRYIDMLRERIPRIVAHSTNRSTSDLKITDYRSIIELVGTVALDVPYPIQPLGGDRSATLPLLELNDVDLEPKPSAEVPSLFDTHHGSNQDHRSETWVETSLEATLNALENLVDEEELNLLEVNAANVRKLLVDRIYNVDPTEMPTMLDEAPPLFTQPAAAAAEIPIDNLIDVPGGLLEKITLESFGEHGGFGAVVYESETGWERKRHPLLFDAPVEQPADPIVPDDGETFGELWNYAVMRRAVLTEFERLADRYRTLIADVIVDEYGAIEPVLTEVYSNDPAAYDSAFARYAVDPELSDEERVRVFLDGTETDLSHVVAQLETDIAEVVHDRALKLDVQIWCPVCGFARVVPDDCEFCEIVSAFDTWAVDLLERQFELSSTG